MQVEPVVLHAAPPGLDHRIREADLDLGDDALQETGRNQDVDGPVLVLDASVGEHGWYEGGAVDRLAGIDEERDRVGWIEAVEQSPREDTAKEVVDDRVQVHAAVVEEADQSRIEMPSLVRLHGSNSDSRGRWVNAKAQTTPPALHDEPQPGRRGREHSDLRDLGRRQPPRRGVRAGRLIRELADRRCVSPGVEPSSGRAEPGEDAVKAKHGSRALDGPKQSFLVERPDAEAGEVRSRSSDPPSPGRAG
jgi:hypothetical protein